MTKSFDEFQLDDSILDSGVDVHKTRSGMQSIYSGLRAELEKPLDLEEDFVYKVRGRDLSVRISADLPLKKLNRWRVAATNKKNGLVDQLLFSRLLIAGQTKCLIGTDGADGVDDQGTWLNFRHQDVQDALSALDYHSAIDNFFGRDAEVIRCGNEILEKAGYGDDEDFDVDSEDEDSDPLV